MVAASSSSLDGSMLHQQQRTINFTLVSTQGHKVLRWEFKEFKVFAGQSLIKQKSNDQNHSLIKLQHEYSDPTLKVKCFLGSTDHDDMRALVTSLLLSLRMERVLPSQYSLLLADIISPDCVLEGTVSMWF